MISHDSIFEVTKPHYAGDLVNTKDTFAALTVTEALEALRIFCLDRLPPNPGCDRLARGVRELATMGIARLYFLLWKGPDWVGLFAGRLGSVTESQLPAGFGPANKKAFNAIVHLLRAIDEGNWLPKVEAFSQLVVLVGKVLLPNATEPGKAAVDLETKGTTGKIPNKVGRPSKTPTVKEWEDALRADPERYCWTADQWADLFNCSSSLIKGTGMWRALPKNQPTDGGRFRAETPPSDDL